MTKADQEVPLKVPAQKPLALLRRFIEASTQPGDMVLDPFAGCATALGAAEELGGQWTGADVSSVAVRLRGEACAPVRVKMEGFRPVFNEAIFPEPEEGGPEPLLGYVILEQAQAAVEAPRSDWRPGGSRCGRTT